MHAIDRLLYRPTRQKAAGPTDLLVPETPATTHACSLPLRHDHGHEQRRLPCLLPVAVPECPTSLTPDRTGPDQQHRSSTHCPWSHATARTPHTGSREKVTTTTTSFAGGPGRQGRGRALTGCLSPEHWQPAACLPPKWQRQRAMEAGEASARLRAAAAHASFIGKKPALASASRGGLVASCHGGWPHSHGHLDDPFLRGARGAPVPLTRGPAGANSSLSVKWAPEPTHRTAGRVGGGGGGSGGGAVGCRRQALRGGTGRPASPTAQQVTSWTLPGGRLPPHGHSTSRPRSIAHWLRHARTARRALFRLALPSRASGHCYRARSCMTRGHFHPQLLSTTPIASICAWENEHLGSADSNKLF